MKINAKEKLISIILKWFFYKKATDHTLDQAMLQHPHTTAQDRAGSLRFLMAGQFPRAPLRGPLRGPSRGGAAVLIDRNYVVLPETPEAAERVSNPGGGARHTYSSLTSGDFPYFTVGGPSGGALRELGWSMFDKFPLWCESLIWWLLPILLFLFLFLLYSAGSLLLPRVGREDYGIVIDAGSHGSRVNIFKWAARVYDPHNPLTGPVSLPRLSDFRVYEPGIERAFEDPEEGKAQLQQMIRDASASLAASGVPASRWGEIPIYLKATAGMRTMGQEKRDSIMRHVRDTFHDPTANPFHFKNDFARVISGEEEGVYGWVAVNSEKNLLGAPPEQTLGALDMGGSSSQITFSPFFTSILEDFNSVHLGNTSIQLYSHSFLGYGWADALTRINLKLAAAALISSSKTLNPKPSTEAKLISPFRKLMEGGRAATAQVGRKQRLLSGPIEHPCFPVGHSFSFTLPQVNQEGLRLYVDLDADTLQALLQVAGVPARVRDKIAAAAKPQGVKARHELQDAEGREEARRRRRGGLQRGGGTHPVSFSKGRGRRRSLKVEQQEQQQSSSSPVKEEEALLQPKEQGPKDTATAGAKTEAGAPGGPPKEEGAAGRPDDETFRMQKVKLPATPRLSAWKEMTERICNMEQEALEVYRRQNDIASYSEKGMRRVCWKATWCYSLLVDGFGFDSEAPQITFSAPRDEKLGGGGGAPKDPEAPGAPGATGWALGSMLIDVNLYPWGMTDRLEFFLYILGAVAVDRGRLCHPSRQVSIGPRLRPTQPLNATKGGAPLGPHSSVIGGGPSLHHGSSREAEGLSFSLSLPPPHEPVIRKKAVWDGGTEEALYGLAQLLRRREGGGNITVTGGPSIMPQRLWGALSNATASARAAWGPSLRSLRAGLGGPPRDRQRQGFGGPQGGPSTDIPLADAAAAVKRRLVAANERLGSWALREAPPAFRLKGGRYSSYPGAPQRESPRRGPLEQQKKANALSGLLLLFAACVVIGTPLYLNSLYGKPKAAAAARTRTGGGPFS
ncbi:hypothetical protein Emed_001604 [Eimeria media]